MIIRFKGKEIELSDWESAGRDGWEWNFWRRYYTDYDYIGFIVNNAVLFKTDPNLASWRIATGSNSGGLYFMAKVYNQLHNNPIFKYSELDNAKQDLDLFLTKFDKLKVFL